MSDRRLPAECFPVREAIQDEMAEQEWDAHELARRMKWPVASVERLLSRDSRLCTTEALDLEAAFGVSAEFWLNLDLAYIRWKAAQ